MVHRASGIHPSIHPFTHPSTHPIQSLEAIKSQWVISILRNTTMAPPSQAGKFKPRKLPKKIKAGSAANAPSSAAAAASAAYDQPTAPSRDGRSSASNYNGRGNGRGRGRGRGRGGGRTPTDLPRGAVFFTGNQPGAAASKRPGSARNSVVTAGSTAASQKDSSITAALAQSKDTSTEEVIVGELDEAIGSSKEATAKQVESTKLDSSGLNDYYEEHDIDKGPAVTAAVETYDSDSSVEEERQQRSGRSSMSLPPTQLPFPVHPMAPGVGGNDLPRALYECAMESETNGREALDEMMPSDPPPSSPFVDWNNIENRQEEEKSWFLMQFPTRLPPMNGATAATDTDAETPDVVTSDRLGVPQPLVPVSVIPSPSSSTNPTVLNTFDNSFISAGAGRLGKMVVYKSGKTVFVLGGQNGSPEIRLNVSEGLHCGFVQQAVSINPTEGTFVPLGDVKKSVVVTPDVDSAFSESE